MSIHIGQKIKEAVDAKGLTLREFGILIGKNRKTIPDIYRRTSLNMDLLVAISIALSIDFLKLYYEEEGMKKFRDEDKRFKLQQELKELDRIIEDKEKQLEQLKSGT